MIAAVKDKEKNTIAAKNTIKILDNSKCFFIFANENKTTCLYSKITRQQT